MSFWFFQFLHKLQRHNGLHKWVTAGRPHAPSSYHSRDRAVTHDAMGVAAVTDTKLDVPLGKQRRRQNKWSTDTSSLLMGVHHHCGSLLKNGDKTSIGKKEIPTSVDLSRQLRWAQHWQGWQQAQWRYALCHFFLFPCEAATYSTANSSVCLYYAGAIHLLECCSRLQPTSD